MRRNRVGELLAAGRLATNGAQAALRRRAVG